jgi:predicted DNA binding CopG/RHH family protein
MEATTTLSLNVRVPRELLARVKMHATVIGKPIQELVAEVLDKALPVYKAQPKGK